jgi:hypothetical protein
MKLLNKYEEVTFSRLNSVAIENDARVFAKVRVADVLPLTKSGISNELFAFGLRAHFDFTVTTSTTEPLFAVEFDGPFHQQSEEQKQRDEKKNLITEHFGFSLLRINSRYIDRTYRGLDLLTYFTEVWFLGEVFEKAQSEGQIPYDEPFDPTWIVNDGRKKRQFPYWLSLDVQNEIRKIKKEKLIKDDILSHWIGIDNMGNRRCLAWLNVTDDRVLLARTGMRNQNFPIDISDILSQIVAFDIKRDLDLYLKGGRKAIPNEKLEEVLKEYQSRYRMCCFFGYSKHGCQL